MMSLPHTSRSLPPIRRKDENGNRVCRGCGAIVPKSRQTWCSVECRDKHYLILSGFVRRKLFDRDAGVCASCGADARLAKRVLNAVWWRTSDYVRWDAVHLLMGAWGQPGRGLSAHLWEADHIVPLVEGGTNDLENMRTLCVPCHRRETRALRARLAQRRKAAK